MDVFIKAVAGVLVTVVLGLTLAKQGKDISVLLVIAVCGMIFAAAAHYLQQIVDFFETLEDIGQLNTQMLTILLKAVGISILSEITLLICNDAGNAALGKVLQILSSAVILWLGIPLFTELLQLAESILEVI